MQVSIRELKANPARAIALMQRGETVQITSHRKVVAELVPPQTSVAKPPLSDEEAMQRLIDSGALAQVPTRPLSLGELIVFPPGPNGQSMSDLVLEMRGPR
jgi:antitoxin (DNA-binding transcriptional repressor) of toxin-antitoxin stability system